MSIQEYSAQLKAHLQTLNVGQTKEFAKSQNISVDGDLKGDFVKEYVYAEMLRRATNGPEVPTADVRLTYYNTVEAVRIEATEDPKLWLSQLALEGVAVAKIPNFDPVAYREQFWIFLRQCGYTVDERTSAKTWTLGKLPHTVRGLFKSVGGMWEFVWRIREAVHPLFAQIWGTTDLKTSYDGMSFMLPKTDTQKFESWWHVDQNRQIGNRCFSIQGVVFLTDSWISDPGFLYLHGSRDLFQQHLDAYPTGGFGWQTMKIEDHVVYSRLPRRKLLVRAGEIVFFDSRVCHSTCPGFSDNYRMVTYVCMQPTGYLTKKELEQHRERYDKARMTNHAVCGPWNKMMSERPRFSENMNFPPEPYHPPYDSLSPLRKSMI